MSSDQLASLGVKAEDVSAVEETVVAAAEVRAAKEEAAEQERLLREVDVQLLTLTKQESVLASARFSTAGNRKLQALRKRIKTAKDRRKRLLEADATRRALRKAVPRQDDVAASGKEPTIQQGESERDFLIRTGKLTPFEGRQGYERKQSAPVRRQTVNVRAERNFVPDDETTAGTYNSQPNRVTRSGEEELFQEDSEDEVRAKSGRKRRRTSEEPLGRKRNKGSTVRASSSKGRKSKAETDEEEYRPELASSGEEGSSGSDWQAVPSNKRKRGSRLARPDFEALVSDADEELLPEPGEAASGVEELETREGDEWIPNNDEEVELEGGLRIPGSIYGRLFDYQKTGVQWLWEIHMLGTGAILGDEMGLGKTIQIIAFLAALNNSGKLHGSVIILAPATVLRQWYREFRTWWPRFRVRILHSSFVQSKARGRSRGTKFNPKAVVKEVTGQKHGVLITSYEQVRKNHEMLLDKFEYVITDEGHKLKSPDAEITLVCKRFDTAHRIIVSGSPLQNHLKELWSLFDFVYPGKLGTLPVFQTEFVVPIMMGGYSTATKGQVHTAFKCSLVLRDLVSPYLLRRMKKDVATQLPEKTEQILFVKLSEEQREKYKAFLKSRFVRQVLNGKLNLLYAITALRKICNHSDIPIHNSDNDATQVPNGGALGKLMRTGAAAGFDDKPEDIEDYGNWRRSGKMIVLERILTAWRKAGSRVLLFSQTRTMLDLLEKFMKDQGYTYQRMDGETPVGSRMRLIDRFNTDETVFIFLLTTRVGGLGVNLTGADRVVLFDPDWNPSTDLQARERAWRVGQKRPVTVYRLVTSGTIEEKIYHRQIYKQFLTNKVLNDPRQRRFFKPKHIKDLFTLGEDGEEGTETGDIFAGTAVKETTVKKWKKEPELVDEQSKPTETANAEDVESGDANLLNSLFDGDDDGGLHSMINHDAVLGAGTDGTDIGLLEYQADKVASNAIEEVNRSARRRRQENIGVPTWTGRSGLAGYVSAKGTGSGGSKAASVLSRIRQREGTAMMKDTSGDGELSKEGKLTNDLVDFLREKGGQSSSSDVVGYFKPRVDDTEVFRKILDKVARLEKRSGPGAVRMWKLREKYMRRP